jgi:hypothetical protein
MNHSLAEVIQTALVSGTFLAAFTIFLLSRRRSAKPDAQASQVLARLERIEQAVDAIAIEVERVSEGQRFTARVLAERSADQVSARTPPKVTTPH